MSSSLAKWLQHIGRDYSVSPNCKSVCCGLSACAGGSR